MDSFAKRLTLIINDLGYSKNSFADLLGYKNNTPIYDYTREDEKAKMPGFEFFEKVIQAKKGINIEWLISGEGDKYHEKGTAATKSEEAAITLIAVQELREQLAFLRLQNTDLTKALLKGKMVEQG